MEHEGLTDLWNAPGFVQHQPGGGGRLLVRQLPIELAVQIADRDRPVDHDRAVLLQLDALDHHVVLVGDLANDLL